MSETFITDLQKIHIMIDWLSIICISISEASLFSKYNLIARV